jgi:carbonic anhydrase
MWGHSRLRASSIQRGFSLTFRSAFPLTQACSTPPQMCNHAEGSGCHCPTSAAAPGAGSPRFCRITSGATLQAALAGNREWATSMKEKNPEFFSKLSSNQAPDWLWIGCSDSRVPANELLGMGPGEVFVQRNVGNLATHKDMNAMSCLEYAVTALKVKHIIVCGHYNCGAVKAALTLPCKTPGLVNLWIQDIRDVRNKHEELLLKLPDIQSRWEKLVELNVIHQVFNVCTSPVVQQAWDSGQPLAVHGLVYSLTDGLLKEITPPITCLDDVEHYSEDNIEHWETAASGDGSNVVNGNTQAEDMSRLSKSLATHMFFEKQALHRESMEKARNATEVQTA